MNLTETRRQRIIDLIDAGEEVLVADLANTFGVSEMTVRRDLARLEMEGRLRRVHGGAVRGSVPKTPPLTERMQTENTAKRAIGALAANLIEPGHRVFVGAGSTALALAQTIAAGPSCHVLTSTPRMAEAIAENPNVVVELSGGFYDAEAQTLFGEAALSAARDRMFDIAFVSAYALDAEFGTIDNGEHQHRLQRILSRQSLRYVVMADHTKFGLFGPYRTLPWSGIDTLVTNAPLEEPFQSAADRAGVQILIAPDRPKEVTA